MCFIKSMQLYCNFIIINSAVSSKNKKQKRLDTFKNLWFCLQATHEFFWVMWCYHHVHFQEWPSLTHQHFTLMGFPPHRSSFFISHQLLTSLCMEETSMIIYDEISLFLTLQYCSFCVPIGHSLKEWVCILSWESFINDINRTNLVNAYYAPGT